MSTTVSGKEKRQPLAATVALGRVAEAQVEAFGRDMPDAASEEEERQPAEENLGTETSKRRIYATEGRKRKRQHLNPPAKTRLASIGRSKRGSRPRLAAVGPFEIGQANGETLARFRFKLATISSLGGADSSLGGPSSKIFFCRLILLFLRRCGRHVAPTRPAQRLRRPAQCHRRCPRPRVQCADQRRRPRTQAPYSCSVRRSLPTFRRSAAGAVSSVLLPNETPAGIPARRLPRSSRIPASATAAGWIHSIPRPPIQPLR
jgi:hypothetical protein